MRTALVSAFLLIPSAALAKQPAAAANAANPVMRTPPGESFSFTRQRTHYGLDAPALPQGTWNRLAMENGGDLDMDGYDDILIGQPRYNNSTGRVVIISGKTGCRILEVPNPNPAHEQFGTSVVGFGNKPVRGNAAFAVGAITTSNGNPGWVHIFDAQGTLLNSFRGGPNYMGFGGDDFGYSLAAVDIDGVDGKDLIVGAPQLGWVGVNDIGEVHVFKMTRQGVINFKALYVPPTPATGGQRFGFDVVNMGDLDGDNIEDFAASASHGNPLPYVEVLSGADAFAGASLDDARITKVIWPDNGTPQGNLIKFGETIANLGDIDGDGYNELGAAAPNEDVGPSPNNDGAAHVFSIDANAGTSTKLGSLWGAKSIAGPMGDVWPENAPDGIPDILVSRRGTTPVGNIENPDLHSGAGNFPLVRRWAAEDINEHWGKWLATLGDIDGDGFSEVVAASEHSIGVVSVRNLYQGLSPTAYSMSAGGSIGWSFDTGNSWANHNYHLLGTTGGTSPGQFYGTNNRPIPLNPSNWFTTTVSSPNQPPLFTTQGVLTPQGLASATIDGATAPLAPGCYQHALVVQNGAGQVRYVSRPVPLLVTP